MRRNKYILLTLTVLVLLITSVNTYAFEVKFGPEDTKLNGLIKYTVIGRYKCAFEEFVGTILLNEQKDKIKAVNLIIESATINSSCGWCDKIVRSKQLLHVEKYPQIIFIGDEIFQEQDGYKVKGTLDMHGVKKEATFPFEAKFFIDETTQERMLDISGKWMIMRKEFNLIWNKFLDKGGVLVGNEITVDWGIKTKIPKPKG